MKLSLKLLLALLLSLSLSSNTDAQNKQTSVLASGDVYKISIPKSGIYKIDYNFLSNINGLDINNIDPRKIHIYGNNGGPVPQVVSEIRPDDLTDNSIHIEGETDGSFDTQDYILIYAEGADTYSYRNNDIEYQKNPYELNNYLYIKVESGNGPRIENVNSLENPEVISSTRETVYRHETDRLNLLGNFGGTQGSGKEWFGESFANETKQSFSRSFPFPNAVPNSVADLKVRFAGRNDAVMRYEVTVDNSIESNTVARTQLSDIESIYAHVKVIDKEITLQGPSPEVNIEFFPNGSQGEGWLDYIEIIGTEENIYSGTPITLTDRAMVTNHSYGFSISNAQNLVIWNTTDIHNISNIIPQNNGSVKEFGFNTESKLNTFIAFNKTDEIPTPTFISKLDNQNLHGINEADFVIITHENFREASEKLATHRNEKDGFNVVVVDIDEIYNEFSSGRVDPTAIRDFCGMLYSRDANFKYLLLMGDASYDYRGLNDQLDFQNYIPTYETDESLDPIDAFPTDDYFGLLSDDEGSDRLDGGLELGVGRIPAQTLDEALAVVDKIINYDNSSATLGDWRMRIGFSADDEDNNTHIRQADGIAELTERNHPEFIQDKVYFDAFNQVATPGGARFPDANTALNDNLNNGQLVLNYLGHGGPKGWAQERVLQINDIINWKNYNQLPVIITATCSFTGFDEPSFVSAGEHAILNPAGGAIALFTTVRAVFSSQNERLTRKVFENIFLRDEGQSLRFGDVLTEAQNTLVDQNSVINTRKFALMGDPSMQLATPKHKVVLNTIDDFEVGVVDTSYITSIDTTINTTQDTMFTDIIDTTYTPLVDTIGALEKVLLSGSIEDYNGQLQSDFNGKLSLTVFDKSSELKTLDNDNRGRIFDFKLRKNILYKGSATVEAGQFSIELILPQDIDFEFGTGMFSFYASDGVSEDAGGHYSDIIIGGTSESELVDNEGPEIDIFFDDRTFISGGQTATKTELIIDLFDETGINLSSTSIGHDITAHIDNKFENGYVLNSFYEANIDKLGSGSVSYPLEDLEPGLHTIYVKAWDILNNSSEETSDFLVVENLEGFISDVINYPNPFIDNTKFAFEHDLSGSNLDITVDIYSMSGVLIKTITEQRFSSGNRIDDIDWNGSDFSGGKIPKGIYLYKIKLVSNELSLERESDLKKLVLLN